MITAPQQHAADDDNDDMQTDDFRAAIAASLLEENQPLPSEEDQLRWAMSTSVITPLTANSIHAGSPEILNQLNQVFLTLGFAQSFLSVLPNWQECYARKNPNAIIHDFNEKGFNEFNRFFNANTKTAAHVRKVAKSVRAAFIEQLKVFAGISNDQERRAMRFAHCLTLMNEPNVGLWSAYKLAYELYQQRKAQQSALPVQASIGASIAANNTVSDTSASSMSLHFAYPAAPVVSSNVPQHSGQTLKRAHGDKVIEEFDDSDLELEHNPKQARKDKKIPR